MYALTFLTLLSLLTLTRRANPPHKWIVILNPYLNAH